MSWYKVSIEITNILESGKCPHGHKIGEKFEWPDDRGKICGSACHAIYPYVTGLRAGGAFPWEKDPESCTICCPDYNNPVVFKMTRGEASE
ncbi:MAG: TIGR04076 family protein [Candidatus Heimdallarchaeota archaeon]